ncbi:MAG: LytTR family transcriptional regulator DNA-binding domain-containing protein [Lachnospiraceae bacterium]|nr:LytTR family transcriptional regulator DNA-binding domain-containing protein [Lachnospiraceae bacterium]
MNNKLLNDEKDCVKVIDTGAGNFCDGSSKIRIVKDKLLLSCVEGNVSVGAFEIIYIETMGHRNIVHLKDQDFHIYEKLDTFEQLLRAHGFLRVHKSYLVNMQHIRNINSYVMTLDNGVKISVPKARYKEVKREYADIK